MCLAVPGRIDSIYEDRGTRMGKVNFGGVVKEVCLAYLPEAIVGDYTIVHVGFAISRIDEASAQETLRMFASLGLLDEELEELRAADVLVTELQGSELQGTELPIAELQGEPQ
jgi:hydrogenase expression/formation protein HypC